jgi:hypothetical protein
VSDLELTVGMKNVPSTEEVIVTIGEGNENGLTLSFHLKYEDLAATLLESIQSKIADDQMSLNASAQEAVRAEVKRMLKENDFFTA